MPPTDQMLPDVPRNGSAPQPVPSLMNGSGAFDPHELLHALQAMQVGDFSVRMAGDRTGIEGKIADTFNAIVSANQRMAEQLERVGARLPQSRADKAAEEKTPPCPRPNRCIPTLRATARPPPIPPRP